MDNQHERPPHPASFLPGGCKHAVHPVVVVVEMAEDECEVVHHQREQLLQLVVVVCDLRASPGLEEAGAAGCAGRGARHAPGVHTQRVHQGLDDGGFPTAWRTCHDDACRGKE